MTFLKVWGSSHTSHPFCTSFTHLCVRLAGSQAPKQCFVNAYFIAPGAPRQLQCFGGLEAAWTPNLTHCSGSQSHSGSSQGLGGAVASCQSRAGHQIQPADPWICTQNNKSHFQLAYILTGLSHREFGVAKEELDILIKSLF